MGRRTLYPPLEAWDEGYAQRGIHRVHWEKSGKSDGIPVIVLHGGPGGSFQPFYRQFFHPERFCVLGFDQRGCGKSTPMASLEDNTTQDLITDIEYLRETHFGSAKVVVFGGSWGSTLALAYAQAHPGKVYELVLRGIFTLRRSELEWFYQLVDAKTGQLTNAANIFPEDAEAFIEPIPVDERDDLIAAYSKRLTGEDKRIQLQCARAWSLWEMATCRLLQDKTTLEKADDDKFALEFARIENHYFTNGGFFEEDNQIIARANILNRHGIRGTIVQGRYDVVCPTRSAYELSKSWTGAELQIIPDSGHSSKEEGIIDALVTACDAIANK